MVKVEVENDTVGSNSFDAGEKEEWNAKVTRVGLAVAKRILPRELGVLMHYDRQLLLDLAEAFGVSSESALLPDRLWEPVALGYVQSLVRPPGSSVSLLVGLAESDLEVKAEMFWRCALRLHMNSLEQLEGMAKRWSEDLELGTAEQPAATPAKRKVQLVKIVLPSFAMVCKTQREVKESEARKVEVEKMKKEAVEKEAKKQAEIEKKAEKHSSNNTSTTSTVSATATAASTTAASSTTAPASTAPSKPPPQPVEQKGSEKGKKHIASTAARHTYDNYAKWDDVNLDEVVDYTKPAANQRPQAQAQQGAREKSAEEQALDAELSEKLQDPELRKHMMEVLGGQFTP